MITTVTKHQIIYEIKSIFYMIYYYIIGAALFPMKLV